MIKKTLQQYKREFEELNEESDEYKILAEQCIADYPDDELGYEELGKYLINQYPSELHYDIKKYEEESKRNPKYGIALGLYNLALTEDMKSYETYASGIAQNNKYFKNSWLALYCEAVSYGNIKEASEYLNRAIEYGADYSNEYYYQLFQSYPPIDRICVKNFLSIKNEIEIKNLKDKKEIYFLGENGVGKTVLLQAILLGVVNEKNEITTKYPDVEEFVFMDDFRAIKSYSNIFAYGISRFRSSPKYTDDYGYATLFDHDTYLTNPEEWLKDIQRKELLGKSSISLNDVMQMLTEIINFEGNEFKIVYNSNNDKFEFIEKDTPTKFEHLADGYRSVLVWLCDLLHRLSTNQPFVKNIKYFGGIVLIDEIDMLLHPKWEYSIVKQLRNKLPNIQWFFTTHSPMLILGASEDAVFYKLYKEAGQTKISEQWKCSDINNMLANSIITSPLFDLETAQMRAFDEKKQIDTNTNYWYSRVEKIINQERAKQKLAGKAYFSDQEIDEIVQKAIVLLKNGGE